MELRALISNPNGHSTSPVNAVDTQLPWYTKDLMVEETSSPTSSPLLSLGPSPCDSTASSPLESPYNNPYARHAPAAAQPIFSLPRPRVSSALAQQKRKRSISDSLVPTASKKRPAEDDDEDEVDVEDFIAERYLPSDSAQMSHHDQPSPRNDNNDDESDGFVESGEEGDDGQADLEPGDASPRRRRLQGHESGPPSPPAFYQHGMNENPDGTAYYHCKFCQNTWPQSHFRNAQQFGAHCSNCSRKRKVKDPQDMTTTTRERNRRMRKNKRSRSISASKASFDKTRHRLLDSDDSTPEPPYSQELVFGGSHYRPAASSARVRPSGAPARPLPPSVLVGRQQPAVGQDAGMEGLLGAMQRRDSAQKRKSIFALLACVKSELASLREIEGGEEVELAGRELLQETRTEWESRIQELRVDAASDLRAHTAGLTRRLDRLRVAHQQGHPASDQQQPRSSLDFILNNASSTAVPTTPPPSPAGAARGHHQHHQALRRAEVLTPAARAHVVPLAPQPPAVVASSSLACPSPLTSPL